MTTIRQDSVRENIGNLLRWGVSSAALLVLAGGTLYLTGPSASASSRFSHFQGESAGLQHVSRVILRALHGESEAIIQAGILVLIATPVARVLFATVSFAQAKDWIYVCISSIVLVLLLWSLLFA